LRKSIIFAKPHLRKKSFEEICNITGETRGVIDRQEGGGEWETELTILI